MDYKNILLDVDGAAATITINRPEKMNALDADTIKSLDGVIGMLAKDHKCKVVIITGAGDKSFCAGADINYLNSLDSKTKASAFVEKVHNLMDKIEGMDKPVIAAIDGYCLGGGLELALSCDIRIATSDAKFAQPEVKIGIIPGGGGTYRLPRIAGMSNAKEMIFTGDMIDAQEAHRIFLVSKVVDAKQLMLQARAIALKITSNSANAVGRAKSAINSNAKVNGSIEKRAFASCFSHADKKEGTRAFLERRKPKFMK